VGQKTHPYGFRLGKIKNWKSRWFAQGDEFPELLAEDETLRKYLHARLDHAAVSTVEIERKPSKIVVNIHTGRPGVVIGKGGSEGRQAARRAGAAHRRRGLDQRRGGSSAPRRTRTWWRTTWCYQLMQRISFRRANAPGRPERYARRGGGHQDPVRRFG